MTALVKVQIARKDLGLAESDYRDILEQETGQRSAKGLSNSQLGKVLERFKARGWTPRPKAKGAPARTGRLADHPVGRKARALWISLYHLGAVREPSELALEAFARRQLKVEKLQWADQRQGFKLIEALKAMAERAGWSQGGATVRVLKSELLDRQAEILGLGADAYVLAGHDDDQLNAEIARRGALIRDRQAAG